MASNVSLGDYETKCLFIEAMLCDLLQLILNEINISMSESNCLKKTQLTRLRSRTLNQRSIKEIQLDLRLFPKLYVNIAIRSLPFILISQN